MRSDSIILDIEKEVYDLLRNSKLSYTEIGEIVGCSRGPILTIKKKYSINRPNIKIKNMRPCKWCGEIEILSGRSKGRENRGKFCSKECYTAWQKSEENRGENNPAWVDGGKHEDYLNHLRKSEEWRTWREAVFQRDNYTCQLCGEKGLELHPHHILQKCDYPDLIFEISNGITLCKGCHMSKGVHSFKSIFVGLFRMLVNKNSEALLMHR